MKRELHQTLQNTDVEDDVTLIDYTELGTHNTPTSAWIAYDNCVYDVTAFLAHHRGGSDVMLAALGTDITTTLDSFHDVHVSRMLLTPSFRQHYGIRLVGRLTPLPATESNRIGLHAYQSRRDYERPDPMMEELRKSVFGFLRARGLEVKKTTPECIILLALFYTSLSAWLRSRLVACLPGARTCGDLHGRQCR